MRRFTRDELIAEFLRVRGSGRAEEQVKIPAIRRALSRSRRAWLRSMRITRQTKRTLWFDAKMAQANDID